MADVQTPMLSLGQEVDLGDKVATVQEISKAGVLLQIAPGWSFTVPLDKVAKSIKQTKDN